MEFHISKSTVNVHLHGLSTLQAPISGTQTSRKSASLSRPIACEVCWRQEPSRNLGETWVLTHKTQAWGLPQSSCCVTRAPKSSLSRANNQVVHSKVSSFANPWYLVPLQGFFSITIFFTYSHILGEPWKTPNWTNSVSLRCFKYLYKITASHKCSRETSICTARNVFVFCI